MSSSPDAAAVIVSNEALESEEPYDLVTSNCCFVSELREQHFTLDEISPDALRSYFVDTYLADANSGGFPLFIFYDHWGPQEIQFLREGLELMGALRQLALVDGYGKIVERLGAGEQEFMDRLGRANEDPDENEDLVALEQFDEDWAELFDVEDLTILNGEWLRSLPHLVAMSENEMCDEVTRRIASQPGRATRIAKALEEESREQKIARALCDAAGLEFHELTAGNPTHEHEGTRTMAWYFRTDRGPCYLVEADGRALLFRSKTHEQVAAINLSIVTGENA